MCAQCIAGMVEGPGDRHSLRLRDDRLEGAGVERKGLSLVR